jgi:hypothetical protein
MQNLSLFIEGTKVDLFDDEVISLTQTIQNVRDIEKVFTDFSKSFTLPASSTNNKIFKHYYNFDIIDGFDARKKAAANIELNYLPFTAGRIKLEGVDLKDNKPYAYRVTFFGNTVNLKDKLGETKLSALTWLNNFAYDYDAASVRAIMQGGGDITVGGTLYSDAIKCPLISYDQLITISAPNISATYDKFKYAIRLWLIVKAIEEQGLGITFTSDSFIKQTSNAQFYDLYMWMHRREGDVFQSGNVTELYTSFTPDTSSMTGVILDTAALVVTGLTGGQYIDYTLDVQYTAQTTNKDYTIVIKKYGFAYATKVVTGGGDTTLTGQLYNAPFGYEVYIEGSGLDDFQLTWQLNNSFLGESNNYIGGTQELGTDFVFYPQEQIPDMKIIDFLGGLFKMFNLTAYETDNGEIKVQTLDDFYATGTTRDVSKYVDINESSVDVALPYREIKFQYEGRGTYLSKQYEQENLIGWGSVDFNGGDTYNGDTYEVTIPFEHMQYYRLPSSTIQIGQFSDEPLSNTNDSSPYFDKPLLLYAPIVVGGDTVTISGTGITTYFIPSNSVSTSAIFNDDTCHFSVEINEYTGGSNFDGSLFINYYEDYISDVFNSKRRLTKVKAYLPVSFLTNYTLADTLVINTRSYRINSITTNLNTGDSELELLNVV